ncbi:MAG TPA: PilZ domain-containing protein [Hyphomicrobium sp.]|nr:PilZ domain-containing protein [Hyphomicrobium sp.]
MRKEERQPVSRPARIELGEGRSIACRIADTSRGGALLLVPDSEWLPKSFALYDTFSDTRRLVQVMWTSPYRSGVRYIDPARTVSAVRKPTGFGKRV